MAFKKLISIITPVYNEEEGLGRYYQELVKIMEDLSSQFNFEVVFIDDGSVDQTWEILSVLCKKDARFRALRFSRNFGSHVALSAGFREVKGDAAMTLASDLQDPPQVLYSFLQKWNQGEGAQIVWGHRRTRQDKSWKVLTSKLFLNLIKKFSLPKNSKATTGSFFFADRLAINFFNQFRESNRITFSLMALVGLREDIVYYDRLERSTGKSGWTLTKMMKTFYDCVIGHSMLPIKLITTMGLFMSMVSLSLTIYFFYQWLTKSVLPGWTGLIVTVTFLFSIMFLLMGLLGEYLFRIYVESMQRPLYFISERLGVQEENQPHANKSSFVSPLSSSISLL